MQTPPSSPEKDETSGNYYDDDDDDIDHDMTSSDHPQTTIVINYTILNENDIRQRINNEISELSSLLSLSKPHATLLLCFFNWSVAKIHDAWFTDESGVRLKLGLLEKPVRISATKFTCGICFDQFSCDQITSAACGHPFCNECWSGYITTSINNNGDRCLVLRCPEPSCAVSIGQDMVVKLVSSDDMDKYSRCLVRSYVEGNKMLKWCPGVGCVYAIESKGNEDYDVTCRCFTSFCWNCEEETHRPVDCETVKNWTSKNQSESEAKLDFLSNAWMQVVECRGVLEWSYAYGYYMPDEERAKKQFFEYLQGEAETTLEKLHNFTEKEVEPFLEPYDPSRDFSKFQTLLIDLTAVTEKYFEKLVRALENGLSDVVSYRHVPSSSSSRKKKKKKKKKKTSTDNEVEDYWLCDRCTFANPGFSMECQMCVGDSE